MAGDGLGVLGLEPPLDGGVARIGGVEVPVEGHFGVDHDAAAVGEWHDDIGSRAGLAVGHAPLLDEVGVAVEPRHLEHPTELHLAPRAAHAVVAHGSRELGCLGLGGPMGDRQVADDGPQRARRVVALPFERDQTLRQRAEAVADRLAVAREHRIGRLVEGAVLRFGELHELGALRCKRLLGE